MGDETLRSLYSLNAFKFLTGPSIVPYPLSLTHTLYLRDTILLWKICCYFLTFRRDVAKFPDSGIWRFVVGILSDTHIISGLISPVASLNPGGGFLLFIQFSPRSESSVMPLNCGCRFSVVWNQFWNKLSKILKTAQLCHSSKTYV